MQHANYDPSQIYDHETGEVIDPCIKGYKVKRYTAGPILQEFSYPIWNTRAMAGEVRRIIESNAEEQARKDAQRKGDERRAVESMDRIIAANFEERVDYVAHYTHEENVTPKQAEKYWKKYIEEVRKIYKKRGITLKYFRVPMTHTATGRPRKRIHHHVIITAGMSRDELETLWTHGRARVEKLKPDKDGILGLVKYLGMHIHGKKRWTGSKNLIIPKPDKLNKKDTTMTKARANILAMDYELARDYYEKKHPDYIFCSMEVRYSKKVPGAYIYVRMRRREAWIGKKPTLFERIKAILRR